MKWLSVLLLLSGIVLAQNDPREYDHSMNILPFQDADGFKYYLTWSSSSGSVDWHWQHDIYRRIISFDDAGILRTELGPTRYIGTGSDEAQEPVDIALNPEKGIALSVWEDGSGQSVDIRGQLHRLNGMIVRANWVIAGGDDSQHSPAVAYLKGRFVVAFTDEAAPAEHAMIKVLVLDGEDGSQKQSFELSRRQDDMWWPVAASDGERYALVCWGDGEQLYGSVLALVGDSLRHTAYRHYLANIDQYYYSVEWLEKISQFLVLAKSGNKSLACLIDTTGNLTTFASLPNAPITRETELAVRWDAAAQSYLVIYPSGTRNVAVLQVLVSSIQLKELLRGENDPGLKDVVWPTTGIACQIIRSVTGKDLWLQQGLVLFAYNDRGSNDAVLLPLALTAITPVHEANRKDLDEGSTCLTAYPNPYNASVQITFTLVRPLLVAIDVYTVNGQRVKTLVRGVLGAGHHTIRWDGKDDSGQDVGSGLYFYRLVAGNKRKGRGIILLR